MYRCYRLVAVWDEVQGRTGKAELNRSIAGLTQLRCALARLG